MSKRRSVVAVLLAALMILSMSLAVVGVAGTAAAAQKKADVVFVFDKTGSMDEQADALKSEVESVSEELADSGVDTRFGLITYESRYNSEVRVPLTDDVNELKDGLGFSTTGGTENASHGVMMGLEQDFRPDAKKIVVVITDEDDDATAQARTSAIDGLDGGDACLVAVSPADPDSGYSEEETLRHMAQERADCGEWTDIGSESFTTVVTDLTEFIEEAPEETETDSGSPSFRIVERSLDRSTVEVGETAHVTAVVENRGDRGGTYHPAVTDRSGSLYSEYVSVGAGTTRTFRVPVSYEQPGEYDLWFNNRYVGELVVEEERNPLDSSDVEVSGASVSRSTVAPGESYEVTALVTNTGNESGVATAEFAASDGSSNATTLATRNVTLDPGESDEVTYEAAAGELPSDGRERTWMVGDTVAGEVSLVDGDSMEAGVIDAYTEPETVAAGEEYDVVAVVHNPDETERLVAVSFGQSDGDVGSLRLVTVGAGETATVVSTQAAPSDGAGTLEWLVNGHTAEPAVDG